MGLVPIHLESLLVLLQYRDISIFLWGDIEEDMPSGVARYMEAADMHASHLQGLLVLERHSAPWHIIILPSKYLELWEHLFEIRVCSRVVIVLVGGKEVLQSGNIVVFKEGQGFRSL